MSNWDDRVEERFLRENRALMRRVRLSTPIKSVEPEGLDPDRTREDRDERRRTDNG